MKILSEIREYIKKNNISYGELAIRTGTSRQSLWYQINGRDPDKLSEDIRLSNLERICHGLGFEMKITLVPLK